MDSRRFDALARTLSAGASRRGALRGLVAAVVALAITGDAEARKRRRKKKRCRKLRQPCRPEGRKCCNGRTCGGVPPDHFCCQQGGEPCKGNGDCCNRQCFAKTCALN